MSFSNDKVISINEAAKMVESEEWEMYPNHPSTFAYIYKRSHEVLVIPQNNCKDALLTSINDYEKTHKHTDIPILKEGNLSIFNKYSNFLDKLSGDSVNNINIISKLLGIDIAKISALLDENISDDVFSTEIYDILSSNYQGKNKYKKFMMPVGIIFSERLRRANDYNWVTKLNPSIFRPEKVPMISDYTYNYSCWVSIGRRASKQQDVLLYTPRMFRKSIYRSNM